jgi:hypothetical protein
MFDGPRAPLEHERATQDLRCRHAAYVSPLRVQGRWLCVELKDAGLPHGRQQCRAGRPRRSGQDALRVQPGPRGGADGAPSGCRPTYFDTSCVVERTARHPSLARRTKVRSERVLEPPGPSIATATPAARQTNGAAFASMADAHAGEALIDGADLERSGRGCSLNCQVDRSAPSNQINENVERDAMNSLSA